MVTGVTYRHPGILVKSVTTLDVLSHGRAYLGIGAAWNEQEHRGLGVTFPPLAERFERLEETLQIALQMWAGDEKAYNGKHYQLERPLNSPRPVQLPHPPILIGGGGEQKTLRLVAQYADACNLFARMGKNVLQHKLDVLREHCEKIGRPYEQIEKTTLELFSICRGCSTWSRSICWRRRWSRRWRRYRWWGGSHRAANRAKVGGRPRGSPVHVGAGLAPAL